MLTLNYVDCYFDVQVSNDRAIAADLIINKLFIPENDPCGVESFKAKSQGLRHFQK